MKGRVVQESWASGEPMELAVNFPVSPALLRLCSHSVEATRLSLPLLFSLLVVLLAAVMSRGDYEAREVEPEI